MNDALRAIAEPRRREILQLITARELPAGEIASHFEVTRPAISQHLRILKDCGLIEERRAGARRLYRARPEGLAELRAFFDDMWTGGLERLRDAAEHEERQSRKENSDA